MSADDFARCVDRGQEIARLMGEVAALRCRLQQAAGMLDYLGDTLALEVSRLLDRDQDPEGLRYLLREVLAIRRLVGKE